MALQILVTIDCPTSGMGEGLLALSPAQYARLRDALHGQCLSAMVAEDVDLAIWLRRFFVRDKIEPSYPTRIDGTIYLRLD